MTLSRVSLLGGLALLLAAPSAKAQIVEGRHLIIFQDGREAGQVLVPKGQDACRYTEYWFVYEGFDFVSVRSEARFGVEVDDASGDLERFLDQMWTAHPDGRLLTAVSTETRAGCP